MPKKLEIVSASQIELFKRCPRLWVERYVLGNKTPSTPAMDAGLAVHMVVEKFLKEGTLPKAGDSYYQVVSKLKTTLEELDLY